MRKILKKIAIRLLLGRGKKELFELVPFKDGFYALNIHPYESADEYVDRMKKALQEQGYRSNG